MSDDELKGLSAAEWKVMRIAWDLQKAMAREIYTVAGELHGWRPPTVKTLLKRLVDKGYLATSPVGNGFVYRPARSALASVRAAADSLLECATASVTGPLLAHMVEVSALSENDLAELQKLIDVKKKAAAAKPKKRS